MRRGWPIEQVEVCRAWGGGECRDSFLKQYCIFISFFLSVFNWFISSLSYLLRDLVLVLGWL